MFSNCAAGEDSWVPWTARRTNQSILKEINPEYLLEELMLKLKLHYFGPLMQRANSLEKTLMLGKIEDRRRKGWQMMRWMHSIIDTMDMSLSKLWEVDREEQGSLACCSPWSHKESDTTEQLKSKNNQYIMLKQCVLPILLRTTPDQFVHLGCGPTQPLAITYDVPIHWSLKETIHNP